MAGQATTDGQWRTGRRDGQDGQMADGAGRIGSGRQGRKDRQWLGDRQKRAGQGKSDTSIGGRRGEGEDSHARLLWGINVHLYISCI